MVRPLALAGLAPCKNRILSTDSACVICFIPGSSPSQERLSNAGWESQGPGVNQWGNFLSVLMSN
jgi:hypothetical protein